MLLEMIHLITLTFLLSTHSTRSLHGFVGKWNQKKVFYNLQGNDVTKMLQLIKANLPLSEAISRYQPLERVGYNSFNTLCCFHKDNNPSMSISDEPGLFYCFSCGVGGDLFHFIKKRDHLTFFQSIEKSIELIGLKDDICFVNSKSEYFGTSKSNLNTFSEKSKNWEEIKVNMDEIKIYLTERAKTIEENEKNNENLPSFTRFQRFPKKPKIESLKNESLYTNNRYLNEDIKLDLALEESETADPKLVYRLNRVNFLSSCYFTWRLLEDPEALEARNYLENRKISLQTAMKFGFGYAPPTSFIKNIKKIENHQEIKNNKNNTLTVLNQKLFKEKQLLLQLPLTEWLNLTSITLPTSWKFIPLFKSWPLSTEYLLKISKYNENCRVNKEDIILSGVGIESRGVQKDIYDRFRNRLMVPIHNSEGLVVGFGGRDLPITNPKNTTSAVSKPKRVPAKYVNSPTSVVFNKGTMLFGIPFARKQVEQKNHIIIVEGYFDVICLHQIGIENVAASMGTAITAKQIFIAASLSKSGSIVLLLDNDEAGEKAVERAIKHGKNLINRFNRKLALQEKKGDLEENKVYKKKEIFIDLKVGSINSTLNFIKSNKIPLIASSNSGKRNVYEDLKIKDSSDIFELFHSTDAVKIMNFVVKNATPIVQGRIG